MVSNTQKFQVPPNSLRFRGAMPKCKSLENLVVKNFFRSKRFFACTADYKSADTWHEPFWMYHGPCTVYHVAEPFPWLRLSTNLSNQKPRMLNPPPQLKLRSFARQRANFLHGPWYIGTWYMKGSMVHLTWYHVAERWPRFCKSTNLSN